MFGGLMWLIAVLVGLVIGGIGIRTIMFNNRRSRSRIGPPGRSDSSGP